MCLNDCELRSSCCWQIHGMMKVLRNTSTWHCWMCVCVQKYMHIICESSNSVLIRVGWGHCGINERFIQPARNLKNVFGTGYMGTVLFLPNTHTLYIHRTPTFVCLSPHFSCSVNEVKVKRDWFSKVRPSTNQTAGWLITAPPLPSAHRWDVRLKVDGEQHGVWYYIPSYRLEFGQRPRHLCPTALHDLYPSSILPLLLMPFVTEGPCWRLL